MFLLDFSLMMNEDINYSSNLEKAISEILPSKNPLDNPDFNAIDYINGILHDEKSLDSIDAEIKKTTQMIYRVEEEIIRSVSQRSRAAEKGKRQLEQAKTSIKDLFEKIKEIKQKASNTENMVNGICSDIRDLDHARRNLQSTINTIKKLQMAMTEINQLRTMVDKCQYNEVGNLLELIKEVLNQFSGWNNIDRIRELQKSFESVQRIIKTQVFDEFEHVDTKKLSSMQIQNLSDACFVIDVMGSDMRKEFIDHFCKRQLTLYELMFKEGSESSKLENTEQRYQWLVKWLKNYDENYKLIFPLQWRVSEAVAEEFCLRTNQKIFKILETTKDTLNVAVLKSALKKTLIFEKFLGEQLSKDVSDLTIWNTSEDGENAENEENSLQHQIMTKFKGIISSCFEHFMYLYVEHQDAYIKSRFDELLKAETWTVGEESPNKVLVSATDMISVFAKVRKRIAILNQSSAFYDIFLIFKKYLGLYADILKDKIGNDSKDSEQDILCCYIINTGEYCSKRAKEMETIIKADISDKFKEKVNLEDEDLKYQEVVAFSVEKLRKLFAATVEPCFTEMNKIAWDKFSAESGVGDASRYVSDINSIIKEKVPLYRNAINSHNHFQFVCDSVFGWLMKRFEESILKSKQISESGAQQLLIDVVQLKKILEGIPSLAQEVKEKHTIEIVGKDTPQSSSSARFVKKVKREMESIEKMLKMIWSPLELLLETYKILIPDHNEKGLITIMKLKGLSAQEQHKILDDYGTPKDSPIRNEISNESKTFRSGFGF